jgi:hypothetical protein
MAISSPPKLVEAKNDAQAIELARVSALVPETDISPDAPQLSLAGIFVGTKAI